MSHSKQDEAIFLLTVSFGKSGDTAFKPLSNAEWFRFTRWLIENHLQPECFFDDAKLGQLPDWLDRERVAALLGRGVALGLLKEKMDRTGLWAATRRSATYPSLIRQGLGWNSPPVFFGCGDPSLLERDGIAIVGSRNADRAELQTTVELAAKAAAQETMVISGGARGVDQTAMLEALQHGGTATGVLADGLLRATTSARYREHISAGRLVLISPYHPEASFNVGNAMDRNKYIYCLSRAAIVISCAHGSGGTWQGAQENLKARWGVPVWFNRFEDYEAINPGPGGFPLPDDLNNLAGLFSSAKVANESMYWNFLGIMERIADRDGLKSAEIYSKQGLRKGQVDSWLKRGAEEGRIEKLKRPVRYRFRAYEPDKSHSDKDLTIRNLAAHDSGHQPQASTPSERQLALPGS